MRPVWLKFTPAHTPNVSPLSTAKLKQSLTTGQVEHTFLALSMFGLRHWLAFLRVSGKNVEEGKFLQPALALHASLVKKLTPLPNR